MNNARLLFLRSWQCIKKERFITGRVINTEIEGHSELCENMEERTWDPLWERQTSFPRGDVSQVRP